MKKRLITTMWLGIIATHFILLSASHLQLEVASFAYPTAILSDDRLKKAAFEILDTKCNVCHRKQNPFMVFNEKNMVKRAPKIYKMVFVKRSMPKGNEVILSKEEYTTLEKWLFTQQII